MRTLKRANVLRSRPMQNLRSVPSCTSRFALLYRWVGECLGNTEKRVVNGYFLMPRSLVHCPVLCQSKGGFALFTPQQNERHTACMYLLLSYLQSVFHVQITFPKPLPE